MAWKKDKFKNIIKHKSGYTWSKEQETKFPEPKTVRVLTVTNVQKELDLSSELYLKDVKEADKVKKAVSKHWSIAVSSNGNRKRIGNAVYIIEDSEYLFASFLTAFKPKKDAGILPEYFFRWLKSHPIQERITAVSEGTTGLGNLDIRFLRNMDIEYPENPNEQTAIASILSKVDEAIEATKNSIKATEKLKKALMQNLLTGKLKPDGTWRTANEFYTNQKFGKVPIGWGVKSIKQLFDFYPTSSYSRSKLIDDGEIGYIHYGDIHTKFDRVLNLSIESVPFIPNELEKKYEKLKDGDLVVSDASEDWDGVGKSIEIINSDSKKVIAGLHTLHLRPKSDDLILGIKGYIMNLHQVSTSIKRMATGAKVYGVSKSSLSKILLPIPTEPEQQAIKKKLDEISNKTSQKQIKIKILQRLKKSLMQNLLTGKVRLSKEFIAQFENELEETNSNQ